MSKRHAHHGGSWKVAYADFVTAMMAFFMVMWLASQDEKIKEAIERSFTNPFMSLTKQSTGIIPNDEVQAMRSSSGNFDSASIVELTMLRRLNDDLTQAMEDIEEEDNPMKIELLSDGLKISLFDRSRRPIFKPDTAELTEYGELVLNVLTWKIARQAQFKVEIGGHTETGSTLQAGDYGKWEISTDRANAARRKMLFFGLAADQVREVAGYADTQPIPGSDAGDEVNRRVDILLKIGD